MLRLDLNRGELITQSPDYHNIVLFPENVDYVDLHDQHIIYFQPDNLPGCPSTGYYTLLHSGNCKILKKQIATQMEKINSNIVERYFDFSTWFYLFKDNTYYVIKTKRGLLNVMYPYKKELKRFISANRWRFRHDADELITQTVIEYEKLSGSN